MLIADGPYFEDGHPNGDNACSVIVGSLYIWVVTVAGSGPKGRQSTIINLSPFKVLLFGKETV